MPKAHRSSYHFAFKLKVIAEAEAVENNSKIARDYGILMVHCWRKDQANLFNGELKCQHNKRQWAVTRQSFLNWIKHYWIGFQRREVKVSLSVSKTMKCFDQLISVRSCCNVYKSRGNDRFWLASFSCCQKKSNNWSKSCAFIIVRNCR